MNLKDVEAARAEPPRCVVVVDESLPVGRAANAAAVLALTVGQRHPSLVGAPLVDASGHAHPGLIAHGIAVLSASTETLSTLRRQAQDAGFDVVAFPVQGQQTTDYEAFRATVATLETAGLGYVGLAFVGSRKPLRKLVSKLGLLGGV